MSNYIPSLIESMLQSSSSFQSIDDTIRNVHDVGYNVNSSSVDLSIQYSTSDLCEVSNLEDVFDTVHHETDDMKGTCIMNVIEDPDSRGFETDYSSKGSPKRKSTCKRDKVKTIKIINILKSRTRKRKVYSKQNKCPRCDLIFSHSQLLYQHVTEVHQLYKCFRCEICKCFKSTNTSLLKHHVKHFQRVSKNNSTVNLPSPMVPCKNCGTSYLSKSALQYHMESGVCSINMAISNSFLCHMCKQSFKSLLSLEKHLSKHTQIDCPICYLNVGSFDAYKDHVANHTKNEINKYQDLSHPKKSRRIAKQSINESLTFKGKKIVKKAMDRLYSCEYCTRTFAREMDLEKHKFSHNGIAPWTCLKCYDTFLTSTKYKEHYINIHGDVGKPFLCTFCDKEFCTAESLRAHERAHKGIKPYECEICKKSFAQRGNLKDHILTHSNERPWKCVECGKSFKIKGDLTKHLIVHSNIKNYHCTYCPKKFSRQSYLTRHLRTHTGEKPYVCDICSKSFSRSENCQDHRRIHTGERPYVCHCGATFKDSGNFCNHKKTHDPNHSKRKRNRMKNNDIISSNDDGTDLATVSDVEIPINDTSTIRNSNIDSNSNIQQRIGDLLTNSVLQVVPYVSNSSEASILDSSQTYVMHLSNVSSDEQMVTLAIDDARMLELLREAGTSIQGFPNQYQLTDQSNLTFVTVNDMTSNNVSINDDVMHDITNEQTIQQINCDVIVNETNVMSSNLT